MRHARATLPAMLCLLMLLGPAAAQARSRDHAADGGTPALDPQTDRSDSRSGQTGASSPADSGLQVGVATLFGPGFYGRRTACGTVLGPATVGVAHRTLPCGTRVEFRYAGRQVTAPVIDRGPYVAGVTWDLTTGAAAELAFSGRGAVASITLGRGAVPAR